jgi:hypothetical protein
MALRARLIFLNRAAGWALEGEHDVPGEAMHGLSKFQFHWLSALPALRQVTCA